MKIISGGQTGVDQAGLIVAKEFGYDTGGMAPKGYKTDDGPNLMLRDIWGLEESEHSDYKVRTIINARNSDATVWFGDKSSPGGKCTLNACNAAKKPFYDNPTSEELLDYLKEDRIKVLNVAGNRYRTNPGARALAMTVLREVFRELRA